MVEILYSTQNMNSHALTIVPYSTELAPAFKNINEECESAIHLYEKSGFQHDQTIMQKFGGEYTRCNVAMNFKI